MGRTIPAVLTSLALAVSGGRAVAALVPIVFASATGPRQVFLDIDLNGDGPGQHDCDFRAMFDPMNGAITMTSVQNPDPPTQPIVGCGATTSGTLTFGNDNSGDFAAMSMTASSYGSQMTDPPPGMDTPLTLPGLLKFIAAAASFLPSTAPDATLPLPDITLPVNVNKLEIHVPADGPATAVVTLCNLNGPAGVFDLGSASLLVPFSFFTDDMNRVFLKLPKFLYEQGSGFVLLDAYIPALGHKLIAALDGDPDHPLAVVDFDALGPCVGRTNAPTMTEMGLILLLVVLVVAGSWHLGRRARFYESLPHV